MLGFTEIDVKQTRFYQDVYAEGEVALILLILNRRFGQLEANLIKKIENLKISQLEALAEALLDFISLTDLVDWLQQSSDS